MQCTEEKLLGMIEDAITDAKHRGSSGKKYHQGQCNGYVKALEQVQFAITVPENEGGTAHLSSGILRHPSLIGI